MAASSFNTPPPAMDFSPSSPAPAQAPVSAPAPVDLAPVVDNQHSTVVPSETLSPKADQAATLTSTSPSPSARSLSKVTSRDQTSVRSRSASLRGPRPMPASATAVRPEPIAVHPTTGAGAGGFPFRPTNAEAVTPTTSAESSMFSNGSQSHETGNADSGSPFTSIDSRKNSLDGHGEGLERRDSTTPKASDETVQRHAAGVAA